MGRVARREAAPAAGTLETVSSEHDSAAPARVNTGWGSSLLARLSTAAHSFRTFMRGVLGADAYDRYVQHQTRVHPGKPYMAEREFWRDRTDEMERNPGARCC